MAGKLAVRGENSPMFLLVTLVFVLLLGCFLYGSCALATSSARSEGFSGGATHEFVLCKVSWCGYCKRTEPVWDDFVKTYGSQHPLVTLRKVDCETDPEGPALAAKYDVQGFPTMLLINKKTGSAIPYNGPREKDSFHAWLRSQSL